MNTIKSISILVIFCSNILYFWNWYISKSWNYENYWNSNNSYQTSYNEWSRTIFWDTVIYSSSNEDKNEEYYIYDYDKEYYDIQDYMTFDTNNCITKENWAKFCEADFEKSDKIDIMYNRYDCEYNIEKKWTFCRFAFEKKKKYIWPTYSKEEIFWKYTDYSDYFDDDWYTYIIVPKNAHIKNNSLDWECDWWYELNDNWNYCKRIVPPKNAHIDNDWDNWVCDYWYKEDKYNDRCEKIIIPDNAYLDSSWRNWVCEYWYRKNSYTESCEKID